MKAISSLGVRSPSGCSLVLTSEQSKTPQLIFFHFFRYETIETYALTFSSYIILASAGVSTGILSKIHMTTNFLTPLTTVLCKRINNNYHNNNKLEKKPKFVIST